MNRINLMIALSASALLLVSCAEDFKSDYTVDAPESIVLYEYLNDYSALKDYVDRNANPNFKLGGAVNVNDFNKGGVTTVVFSSNFDEVTANKEMQHASVVDDAGLMKFVTVANFVETARNAGLEVFGNSLLGNAQQNVTYLNTLLEDKPDPNYVPTYVDKLVTENNPCIVVHAGNKVTNPWDTQFWVEFETPLVEGDEFEFSMRCRADSATNAIGTQIHKAPSDYLYFMAVGNVEFTTKWKKYTNTGTVSSSMAGGHSIAFNLNDYVSANNYYFDDISFKVNGVERVKNGDCSGTDVSSFYTKEKENEGGDAEPRPSTIEKTISYMAKVIAPIEVKHDEDNPCIIVHSGDKVENAWDTQFWIDFGTPLTEGDEYEFSMRCRADSATGGIATQIHKNAGDYLHWMAVGNVSFSTAWKKYTYTGTVDANMAGGHSIAFNLNDYVNANNYYFDDMSFVLNGKELVKNGDCSGSDVSCFWTKEKEKAGGDTDPRASVIVQKYSYTTIKDSPGIPLTEEEKADVTNKALNKWISGSMKNTDGYITSWNVVDNLLATTGDEGGILPLKHAETTGDLENNFYWQDYIGDVNVVRNAVSYARHSFQGDASSLKLFVNNDATTEMAAKSIVSWIGKWENDTTKIDGISAEMHVYFSADGNTQAATVDELTKSLAVLGNSGKLVRISALDIGYKDADGNVCTALTEDQHKQMSQFYNEIIKLYFESIPAELCAGITQWTATDLTEPKGLWDSNYKRKHTYAGFADGLSGK
ncbi:MAG: endo-1,4-beta-xylanase [Salinivirgaceae bacterium]|nr:endo-1,4-beta-xylanase [Salinivirgaceae bacterium]